MPIPQAIAAIGVIAAAAVVAISIGVQATVRALKKGGHEAVCAVKTWHTCSKAAEIEASRLNIPGVPNGYRVDDTVWRSAQPEDSAWPLLYAAGCRGVVDLNNKGADLDRQFNLAQAAGITLVGLEWNGEIPPSQAAIKEALYLIDRMPSPVLVHCKHGSDRTGTLVATWRMHHDGWDLKRAVDEAIFGLRLQGMHEIWMVAAVAAYSHQRNKP